MSTDEKPEYDLPTDLAKTVVMRHIAATLVATHAGEMWEQYPEIGEDDWLEITSRLSNVHDWPTHQEFKAAYAHLASRADHS